MTRIAAALAVALLTSLLCACSDEAPSPQQNDPAADAPRENADDATPAPGDGGSRDDDADATEDPSDVPARDDRATGEEDRPEPSASVDVDATLERIRAMRQRGRIAEALREARVLLGSVDGPEQRARVKPVVDELRRLNRQAGELRSAIGALADGGARARFAEQRLLDSGEAGRLLLRAVVREAEPDVAGGAAEMLAELGDEASVVDVLERLADAETESFIERLAAAVGELAGGMSDIQAQRVWSWLNQREGASQRAAATILVNYARRAAGAEAQAFDQAVGEAGAYDRLQRFIEQARASAKADASEWAAAMLSQLELVWTGHGETNLASEPANWAHGVLPTENTIVRLDNTSTKNLVWDGDHDDLPKSLAGWVQTVGYTGAAEIQTTYDRSYNNGFNALRIAGDVTIEGGTVTHTPNPKGYQDQQADVYRLRLIIEGDLTIGEAGAIDVAGHGYAIKGFTNGGASHGGRGSGRVPDPYGSVFSPTLHGMGAMSGSEGNYPGGGAVHLTVAGRTELAGAIRAGVPFTGGSYVRAAAGGSILLETGSLNGGGSIDANGGSSTGGSNAGPGGGGRIAIKLTDPDADFDAFTGDISAREGARSTGVSPWAAAGSIFLSPGSAARNEGRLVIDYANRPNLPRDTSIHPHVLTDEDLGRVTVILRNQARLAITRSRTLAGLTLEGRDNELMLEDEQVLTVAALEIGGQRFEPGDTPLDADALGPQVTGSGRIKVVAPENLPTP